MNVTSVTNLCETDAWQVFIQRFYNAYHTGKTMIELTAEDVSVILKHAGALAPDFLPTAELNDDGQTEIVRWIQAVGKLDDQLTPYAWFSLAEEAAGSHDPDEPVMIEMLPTYTLSGESEMLELSREQHFDWSIESMPVELIENAEELHDAGVPLRFLLLAEVAGQAFAKRVCELYPEVEIYETQLMVRAMNAIFGELCESAGVFPEEMLHAIDEDDHMPFQLDDEAEFEAAVEEGMETARDAIQFLAPELGATVHLSSELFFEIED